MSTSSPAMFSGSIVALVTPFTTDDKVDEAALERLIDWHVEQGTAGLVPCGTTGESATFTHEEQYDTVKRVVELADGRLPVIAGAGSNSTKEAVALAQAVERAGADAVLSVTPYYNKPTQDGLIAHYTTIGEATGLPLVLYHVPSRTSCSIQPETAAAIAERVTVAAVKEADDDLSRTQELLDLGLQVLSGDDGLTFPRLCMGGAGVISVVANFAPRVMADLCTAVAAGDLTQGRAVQRAVHALTKVAFCETNPIPAKTAVAALGFCAERFRLPLVPMSPAGKERLLGTMKTYKLLDAAASC